jgi:hypothetical protein
MKIQVHLTIQSDEGQVEAVHEVARLERGPLKPDTLRLSLAPGALNSLRGWSERPLNRSASLFKAPI